MESYHKRKKHLEEKYGRFINVEPYNNDIGLINNKQQKCVKQIKIYLTKRD